MSLEIVGPFQLWCHLVPEPSLYVCVLLHYKQTSFSAPIALQKGTLVDYRWCSFSALIWEQFCRLVYIDAIHWQLQFCKAYAKGEKPLNPMLSWWLIFSFIRRKVWIMLPLLPHSTPACLLSRSHLWVKWAQSNCDSLNCNRGASASPSHLCSEHHLTHNRIIQTRRFLMNYIHRIYRSICYCICYQS